MKFFILIKIQYYFLTAFLLIVFGFFTDVLACDDNTRTNIPPAKPSGVAPADAIVELDQAGHFTLTSSAYTEPEGDAHSSTQWQISSTVDFNNLLLNKQAVANWGDNLTTLYTGDYLESLASWPKDKALYWRVRYADDCGWTPWSEWSSALAFQISSTSSQEADFSNLNGNNDQNNNQNERFQQQEKNQNKQRDQESSMPAASIQSVRPLVKPEKSFTPGFSADYCLNQKIVIKSLDDDFFFGPQRLDAKIKIKNVPVARYLKWTDKEVVVTPAAKFSGLRSPMCLTGTEAPGATSTYLAFDYNDITFDCPNTPDSRYKRCKIPDGKDLEDVFNISQLCTNNLKYAYQKDQAKVSNICVSDQVLISLDFFVGEQVGQAGVYFWSNQNGWYKARDYLLWSGNQIKVLPPKIKDGRTSPDCPRQGGKNQDLTIFSGPIKVCKSDGKCFLVPLIRTNVSKKVRVFRKILTNKQFLVSEEVEIKGRFFSDIKNQQEFNKASAADQCNTAYVEFYSEELGWVPAGGYDLWNDTKILAKAPAISLEDTYGGPANGVSVASWPIRVCTPVGCSTNLQPSTSPIILAAAYQNNSLKVRGENLANCQVTYRFGREWANQQEYLNKKPDVVRYCNNIGECDAWDLNKNQRIEWHYPEAFAISPICLAVDPLSEKESSQDLGADPEIVEDKLFITVYGDDLSDQVISGGYLILDDGNQTKILLQTAQDNARQVNLQTNEYIVFQIPKSQLSKINIPAPADNKNRERQVIVAHLFLESDFIYQGALKVPSSLTLSNRCAPENSCEYAPFITNTNLHSFIGESPNKEESFISKSESQLKIEGCNFGSGPANYLVLDDLINFKGQGNFAWSNDNISLSTPFGAKSGLLTVNVWTGLLEYSAIWLDGNKNKSQTDWYNPQKHPRPIEHYNVLPTISYIGGNIGPSDIVSQVIGGDFCGPNSCTDILSSVSFGNWQQEGKNSLLLTGAKAQVFDYADNFLQIKTASDPMDIITYGDIKAKSARSAVSGQLLVKRGDQKKSFILPADSPADFFLNKHPSADGLYSSLQVYYQKTPLLTEFSPNKISKRQTIFLQGQDYYNKENISSLLPDYYSQYNPSQYGEIKLPHAEFALDSPYHLLDVDLDERDFTYPGADFVSSIAYKKVPDYYYAFGELERLPFLNNPNQAIVSNWDGAFSSLLVADQENVNQKMINDIKQLKEVLCYNPEVLVSKDKLPNFFSLNRPLEIKKINKLPCLDSCFYCARESLKIYAQTGTSFYNKKYDFPDNQKPGQVYQWDRSVLDWRAVPEDYINWSDNQISIFIGEIYDTGNIDFACNNSPCSKLSSFSLPIKFCRFTKDNDPVECIAYYPKTHIKAAFFSAVADSESLIFAGDNIIDKLKITENYKSGSDFSLVELYINKVYNDIKKEEILGNLNINLFNNFDVANATSELKQQGVFWINYSPKEEEPYNGLGYNATKRFWACMDNPLPDSILECQNFEALLPGFLPDYGDKEYYKDIRLFSYGLSRNGQVYLKPASPEIFNVDYNYNSNYLQIKGENFYNSTVNLGGYNYTASSPKFSLVSSKEIRISLPSNELDQNIYEIKIINTNYGALGPVESKVFYWRK